MQFKVCTVKQSKVYVQQHVNKISNGIMIKQSARVSLSVIQVYQKLLIPERQSFHNFHLFTKYLKFSIIFSPLLLLLLLSIFWVCIQIRNTTWLYIHTIEVLVNYQYPLHTGITSSYVRTYDRVCITIGSTYILYYILITSSICDVTRQRTDDRIILYRLNQLYNTNAKQKHPGCKKV